MAAAWAALAWTRCAGRRRVRPGDTLTTEIEVLEARPSRSKPDRGVLRLAFTMRNQAGEVAVRFQSTTILRRRPGA